MNSKRKFLSRLCPHDEDFRNCLYKKNERCLLCNETYYSIVLNSQNPTYAYWYIRNCGYSKPIEKIILESEDGHIARWYAELPNYNGMTMSKEVLRKLEDIVINSKDLSCIYDFAMYIKNSDIEKLEKAMIDSGDVDWIALFKSGKIQNGKKKVRLLNRSRK